MRPFPVGRLLLSCLTFLLVLAAPSVAAGPQTFTSTGSVQHYTVPAGVTQITAVVTGGGGGSGCWGGAGGAGATVQAKMSVTPGEALSVVAGGKGGTCDNTGGWSSDGHTGGGGATSGYGYAGAGGGGASLLSRGDDDLIIAGAGGGSNLSGADGGAAGSAGAVYCCFGAQGGQPGSSSTPGSGGDAGTYGTAGSAGDAGAGGAGGSSPYYGVGGGGGGGYFGGGGGGGEYYYGAGGGGGSSFVKAGLISTKGVADGAAAGEVVIYEGDITTAASEPYPQFDQPHALINGQTVVGGMSSPEARIAQGLGYTVDVVSDSTWGGMSQAQFAQYQLLIAGDPACGGLPSGLVTSAKKYGPVVAGTAPGRDRAGNRVLVGTDPVFHGGTDPNASRLAVVRTGIAYAGLQPNTTGMYFAASCSGSQSLPVLTKMSTGEGSWTVNGGPPCGGSAAVIASHPSFASLTSDTLQGWGCSVHETFPTFPSDWAPLAVATDTPSHPTCGIDPSTGRTECGEAYVLIAGSGIVLKSGSITLAPATSSGPQGGSHTVTAHVNSGSDPLVGQKISFSVTGVNAGASGTCAPVSCESDSNGDVSFTYSDADGAGDDTIKASFKDARGSLQAATAQRTWEAKAVQPPSATLDSGNATTVDEGTSHTYAFTTNETAASVETSCGDNGVKVSEDASSVVCRFRDGPATSVVSVTPEDAGGTAGTTATQSVTVSNVAPTVTLDSGNPSTVDESSAQRTVSYAISDPGQDTVASVTTSCGSGGQKVAGSDTNTDSTGSFKCVFPDGGASSVVGVSATDSDGATGLTASQTVSVRNVAPTVRLYAGNPSTVVESQSERSFSYSVIDPGVDTVAAVSTSCGSGGTKVAGSDSFTDSSGSFRCVFVNGPATSKVSVSATDSDGDTGATDSQDVSVTDPRITATGSPVSGVEAAAFSGQKVGSFTDPTDYATASEYTASITWGDGSSSTGTITRTGPGQFDVTGSHTYAEEGSFAVTLTVRDADNAANTDTASSTAKVSDAPIHAQGGSLITTPAAYSGPVATFSDEASGPKSDFSATVNWGDGSSSAGTISGPDAGGKLTVSGSHTYATTGPFTVTVKVDDVGGSTDSARTDVLVYAFATAAGGSFTVSDKQAVQGGSVTYWGAQWEKANPFSSGLVGSSAFKGYIEPTAAKSAPKCGTTWTSNPGNSSGPPSSVPAYMAVVVAGKESKSGSTISGDVKRVVVVKTDVGYDGNPGHTGTGKVVGVVC